MKTETEKEQEFEFSKTIDTNYKAIAIEAFNTDKWIMYEEEL